MAESIVQVTEGAGKKLHTFQRTIGANAVEDEVVLNGLPYYATYVVPITGISIATAASHILQVMAGGSLNVYIVRLRLWQAASATTAAYCEWSIRRLSTAGTGGTAITPAGHDPSEVAAGATSMTLPTVKGTEGGVLYRSNAYMTQTPGAAGVSMLPVLDWSASENGLWKPIKIAAGTTNGLAIRNDTGVAAATVTGTATFIEANF